MVDLGKVAAGGAQLLPYIWDSVKPEDLYSHICQIQGRGEHLYEDFWISVVQVPLEGVEGGKDPFLHLFVPDEVSWSCSREHFRCSLLILVRICPVRKAHVVVLVVLISFFCCLGPLVCGGCMVHYKVQAEADSMFSQLLGKGFQVLVGAEARINAVEVLNSVSSVVVLLRHLH